MREQRTIAYTDDLTMHTQKRCDILDITDHVERVRAAARLADGYVLVSTMHITASIFVNGHESEDNADAHLKRISSATRCSSR